MAARGPAIEYYLYQEKPEPEYFEAEALIDRGLYGEAREYFSRACDRGTGGACAVMGHLELEGLGRAANEETGCGYFEKSCELGFAQACRVYGGFLQNDFCGKSDFTEVRRLFEVACDVGDGSACFLLALHLKSAPESEQELSVVRNAFFKACNLADKDACREFAVMLMTGEGGDKDLERSKVIIEHNCQAGDANSCYLRATFPTHDTESDTAPDEFYLTEARLHFGARCSKYRENGDVDACYNVAAMMANGEGGPKQTDVAAKLFEAACQQEHELSCVALSKLEL